MLARRISFFYFSAFLAVLSAFLSSWAVDLAIVPAFPFFYVCGVIGLLFYFFDLLVKRRRIRVCRAEVSFLVFIFWAAASVSWSKDPVRSMFSLNSYLSCLVAFSFMFRVSENLRSARIIGWAIVAGCGVACIIVLLAGAGIYSYGIESDDGRATVGELNGNFVAYVIATSLPVVMVVNLLSVRGFSAYRFLVAAYLVLGLAAVMFLGSRGALVGAFITLCALFIDSMRKSAAWALLWAFLLIFSFFAFVDYLPSVVVERLFSFIKTIGSNAAETDMTGREEIWPFALQAFMEHPIFGIGVGAFPTFNPLELYAHSMPLTVAAELGAVGLVVYLSIILIIFKEIVVKPVEFKFRLFGLSLVLTWLVIGLTGVWEATTFPWLVFGWMVGVARNFSSRTI